MEHSWETNGNMPFTLNFYSFFNIRKNVVSFHGVYLFRCVDSELCVFIYLEKNTFVCT